MFKCFTVVCEVWPGITSHASSSLPAVYLGGKNNVNIFVEGLPQFRGETETLLTAEVLYSSPVRLRAGHNEALYCDDAALVLFETPAGRRGKSWYTSDQGSEIPGLLAQAFAYASPRGNLGVSCHSLVLLPRGVVVAAHRSGRHNKPDVVYYQFDGCRLLSTTKRADWGTEDSAVFHA